MPGTAPGWPGWLVTRASSPPDMHDNKAEHPAGTRAACQLPKDNRTYLSGCLVPITLRGAGERLGRCQAPGRPDSGRVCPHPPQTLKLPRFPYSCALGFPEPGCRIPVALRAGSGLPKARIRPGRAGPAISDSRAGSTEADPGVPGVGTRRPRCGPGSCRGHGQPDRPRLRAGWPSRRPRAGSPLMTSPGPRGNHAAPVVTPGTGRTLDGPVSMRDRVPGWAGHAPPAEPGKPAVHRHRQQLQRRRRGDQHAGRRPGPVNQRRPSEPAAASATGHRPPPAPSGSEQAKPGHEQHQHRDPQRRGSAGIARPARVTFSGPITLRYGRPV